MTRTRAKLCLTVIHAVSLPLNGHFRNKSRKHIVKAGVLEYLIGSILIVTTVRPALYCWTSIDDWYRNPLKHTIKIHFLLMRIDFGKQMEWVNINDNWPERSHVQFTQWFVQLFINFYNFYSNNFCWMSRMYEGLFS